MDKTTIVLLILICMMIIVLAGGWIYEVVEGSKWSGSEFLFISDAKEFEQEQIKDGFKVERINNVVYVREKKDERI